FGVWSQSYQHVIINATNPIAPINYTSSDLLGITADSTHKIVLFVDNQISNAGPSLNLDTLDHGGSPLPSCITQRDGGGHTISLNYVYQAPTALSPSTVPPTLQSGAADPGLSASLFYAPGPHVSFGLPEANTARELGAVGFPFLVMRVGA
ncbi:MAG: hypothetical protein L3K09_08345, partial [Thermoplasmata archaeon]|nr:hypothetical protein [Thermoplasmata archaeon]